MITLTREEAQQVLDALECMNEGAFNAEIKLLRARLSAPEQEQTRSEKMREAGITRRPKRWSKEDEPEPEHPDAIGSPCPEFWDWLPKAYGQSESFTKYNMEVAFLAGAQLSARQQPVAYMGTDIEGNPNKFRLNAFGGSIPLYTTPPQREWQGLTDEECLQNPYCAGESDVEVIQLARAIEQALKEKNT